MSLLEPHHVGIVVPDLEAGQARVTELLGAAWRPVVEQDVQLRDGAGNDLEVRTRVCYSAEPPYLELIQEAPGSPWVCNEHSNLHHIAFLSHALAADSEHLTTAACPLELVDSDRDGPPAWFAYHRDPLGIRIELMSARLAAAMESGGSRIDRRTR